MAELYKLSRVSCSLDLDGSNLILEFCTDLLETDPEGNPQYPPLGMPVSRYSPEGQDH